MVARGLDWWISSLRASRASHTPSLGGGGVPPTRGISGPTPPESLAKYDPVSRCWKTFQESLLTDFSVGSLVISSRWGIVRDGEFSPLPTPARRISGNGSGLWPTPTVGGGGQTLPEGTTPTGQTPDGRKQTVCLERYVLQVERKQWPTPTKHGNYNRKGASPTSGDGLATAVGGRLNPDWTEWLMGWPIGWTGLAPLATDKFQRWCAAHGVSL